MENMVTVFCHRNIDPLEQGAGNSRDLKELFELMGRNCNCLHETMAAEQWGNLTKYDDCVNEVHIVMEIFSYVFGFGDWLMLATLSSHGKVV